MSKVFPQTLLSNSTSSSSSSSSSSSWSPRKETLTIWMQSLVMNGNGCTVYDSDGHLAYRVDNYGRKCSDEVYLMDHKGKTLTKILRKKMSVFGRWDGYRCDCKGSGGGEKRPWFSVRKACRILKGDYEHTVKVGGGSTANLVTCYKIVGFEHKLGYKITGMAGEPVGEVRRKHTASGVALGEDVLSLVLEPGVDQLLVMGVVIVCGLINHSL